MILVAFPTSQPCIFTVRDPFQIEKLNCTVRATMTIVNAECGTLTARVLFVSLVHEMPYHLDLPMYLQYLTVRVIVRRNSLLDCPFQCKILKIVPHGIACFCFSLF